MAATAIQRLFTGRITVTKASLLKSCVFGAAAAAASAFAAPALAAGVGACLITKTDTNPFFVKMKEGATAKAKELGVTLKSYAGKIDGDSESQVARRQAHRLLVQGTLGQVRQRVGRRGKNCACVVNSLVL